MVFECAGTGFVAPVLAGTGFAAAIDLEEGTASLNLALAVASYFELGYDEARSMASQVGQAVATWRKEAGRQGLSSQEIDRVASAFEHDDLKAALALSVRR